MVGDDLLTRKASSINMRCGSATRQSASGRRERQARGQGLTSPAWARGKLSWVCWVQVYGERIDFGITGGMGLCIMICYQMIKDDTCLFEFVLCVTYFNVSIRTYPLS